MQRLDYQALTDAVIATVKNLENEGRQPTMARIVARVLQDTEGGPSRKKKIPTIVQALVASGRLGGYLTRTGQPVKISYKELGQGGTGGSSNHGATRAAEVVRLRAELSRVQQQLRVVTGERNSSFDAVANLQREVEAIKYKLAEALKEASKAGTQIAEVHIKRGNRIVKKIKGLFHAQFKRLLDLAKARANIFIYGPTGCGKSYVCQQLAEALNLPFAFVSCTSGMSEGVLGGRLLPVGKQGTFQYVISEFINCYENGGVFLLDEIDAADPNVLLLINSALANGKVSVPNRPSKPYAQRHPDFICIAAANTAGTGADRLYSGRNKLDGATLDRFQVGKVIFEYDQHIESQLCPDDELRNRCLRIRKAIDDHRLERAMSTRFMRDAYVMVTEFKWTYADLDVAFFAGWREDEVNKVKQSANL